MNKKWTWFTSFLLSTLIASTAGGYFWTGKAQPTFVLSIGLGATIGWMILSKMGKRIAPVEPLIDERHQQHNLLAGYWSFLVLNLLVIGALLQPWLPLADPGLWTGILMSGLAFYLVSLVALDRKR